MTPAAFTQSVTTAAPPPNLPPSLEALWWDARGDWARAHSLVDELETPDAMAVHAYLHRKEGSQSNADYWYRRAGFPPQSINAEPLSLEAEWTSLVEQLLQPTGHA